MATQKQTLNLILIIGVIANLLIHTTDVQAKAASKATSVGGNAKAREIKQILDSTVVFNWDRGKTFGSNHESLGTKLSPNTVLTHNHFSDLIGTHMVDLAGPDRPHGVSSRTRTWTLGRTPWTGPQTRLVKSAVRFMGSFAVIASRREIDALSTGDQVEVVYWNDSLEEVAVVTLTVLDVVDGLVVELDDPANIINVGDSGGGVFHQGELIGNTWRTISRYNGSGRLIEKTVQVHIVPEEVTVE